MMNNASILITGGTGSFGQTFVLMTVQPALFGDLLRDEMKQEMAKCMRAITEQDFYRRCG